MSKNDFGNAEMSPAALATDAKEKLHFVVQRETQRPGDWLNAVRRVARAHGVPYRKLWAVLYDPPKDISASVYLAILAAHARQERRFNNVRQSTQLSGPVAAALHRMAGAMAGEDRRD